MEERAKQLLAKSGGSYLHTVNGLLVPVFVQQETVDELKELQLYPDDVWVVSYPKSGTTWMQQIVRLIRNNGVQDDVKINVAIPWLEGISVYPGLTTYPNLDYSRVTCLMTFVPAVHPTLRHVNTSTS